MNEEIFEELEIVMADRLSNAFNKNDEYKQAISKESELYEQLKNGLTEEQQEMLEEYFMLSSTTTAVCEKIAYRQGMEDLTVILGIGNK